MKRIPTSIRPLFYFLAADFVVLIGLAISGVGFVPVEFVVSLYLVIVVVVAVIMAVLWVGGELD